jgi:hypothetical protein
MTTRLILKDIDLRLAAARSNDRPDAAHRDDAPDDAGCDRRGARRRRLHGDSQARGAAIRPVDRASKLMADTGKPVAARLHSHRRRVIVVGGSLVGLIAGNLFHRLGWEVAVFERTTGVLEGRGAGITVLPGLVEGFRAAGVNEADLGAALGIELPGSRRAGSCGSNRRRAPFFPGNDLLGPSIRTAGSQIPVPQRRNARTHRAKRCQSHRFVSRTASASTQIC